MGLGAEFCAVGSPYGGGSIQGFACGGRSLWIIPRVAGVLSEGQSGGHRFSLSQQFCQPSALRHGRHREGAQLLEGTASNMDTPSRRPA
ncbi:hypothetical protein J4Q44_G00376690 [Coregonus suidteri]|uniref:Uncharacterized protein n=1 Tax=Coregonus suidteri TaxID=861788 RepID=A0AAN8KLL8_9TELE